jgi:hypothetical protein
MSTLDYCRAVTIGFTVFAGTLLLSIPLVAVYALLINPGQSQEFYRALLRAYPPPDTSPPADASHRLRVGGHRELRCD